MNGINARPAHGDLAHKIAIPYNGAHSLDRSIVDQKKDEGEKWVRRNMREWPLGFHLQVFEVPCTRTDSLMLQWRWLEDSLGCEFPF